MKIVSLKNILSLLFVFLYSNANWAQVTSHSRTTTAVTLPYSQNFEGSTPEWTLQSSSPNKWVVGTATKNGGSKGLYISRNNGVSNTYLTSQDVTNGYSQTYASFQVDLTGISNAELKFDWKSVGFFEADYGDVWINTGGSDILISYMDPQVNNSEIYGEFTNGSVYANKTIGLFPYVGGVVTIKFRWKCGYSILSEFPAPFAIDNVTVTSIAVPAPTIDWQSITNLTATSATIGCNISSAGTNPITARGVVYGTSPNPTTANSVITSGSGTGVYYADLTGLSIHTHYYFKGYCTTSAGTFYSSQVEFDTNNISAPVASSASSVGATGFTANWGSESLATGYKIDVATSATIFTNYTPDSNFVTFDFENGEQTLVNTTLSNSNNAATFIGTSNGVYNSANELGNGGEVKKVTGWHNGVGTKYYRVDFNSQTMYNMKLSSKQRSTTNGPKNYKLQYSLGQNGLENWIDISGGTIICADNFTTGVLSDLALPAAMENLAVVSLRWVITSTTAVNGSTLTNAGENNIDDIIIKGSTPQTLVSGYDNLTVSGTSKVVTGLSPLTNYYYRVRSTATGAVSGNSNVIGPIVLTCETPTSVAASTTVTGTTSSSITAEFTAASVTPTGYLVVRTTTNTQPNPVAGTTYTVGSNAIGYIEYVNTLAGSWTSSGLTANATYYYWVFSYINGNCTGGPVYSTSATTFNERANQVNTWTGVVSSSWNTGGNWSTGSVPASTDNIVIDSNATNGTILDTNFTLAAGQKLTLSGTGTLTINATSKLTIAGYADFGGKSVTLKSNSSGTATLGQVTGTLTGETNVTVERYIPAKRAWRAITAPLKGWVNSSIYSSWMNNNQSGVSDATGMLVFGPTTNWGIQMAPNYNLLTYNANDTWSGVSMPIASSTLFSSTINNAFMAFITGPFGSSNIASGATATTLKANGQLITGTQTYSNLASTAYSFIGNPYASPISPSAILTDNANFSNIWVWDPQLASHGAYVVYSGSAYSNTSGSYTSGQPIQSGQAFFVKPSTSSNFVISESHKSNTVDNGLFDRTTSPSKILRVNLYKQVESNWQPFDAVMALFNSNASNAVDAVDAVKMFNANNNITIQTNGVSLMAEHRTLPVIQDVINLRVNDTETAANYKLAIQTEDFTNMEISARLEDLLTNTSVPILLNGSVTEYAFVPDAAAQNATDRFRIVFGAPLSNDTFGSDTLNVYPNPFTGASFQIHMENTPVGIYKYSIINTLGQVVDQGKINVIENAANLVTPKIPLTSGLYILKLIDNQNKEYSVKLMKQ